MEIGIKFNSKIHAQENIIAKKINYSVYLLPFKLISTQNIFLIIILQIYSLRIFEKKSIITYSEENILFSREYYKTSSKNTRMCVSDKIRITQV